MSSSRSLHRLFDEHDKSYIGSGAVVGKATHPGLQVGTGANERVLSWSTIRSSMTFIDVIQD
jgi:hypothetical protein